jgi:hypothetical protein
VALLARVTENDLVARGSFFQRDFIRKQRHAGLPLHLIAHEDVLLFRATPPPPNSPAPIMTQSQRSGPLASALAPATSQDQASAPGSWAA